MGFNLNPFSSGGVNIDSNGVFGGGGNFLGINPGGVFNQGGAVKHDYTTPQIQTGGMGQYLGQSNQYGQQANAATAAMGTDVSGIQGAAGNVNRTAGQYGQVVGGLGALAGQMGGTAGTLQDMVNGGGPNPAGIQMAQGLQAAQDQARSSASSARGNFGLAGAEQGAMNTQAQLSQQAVDAAAAQRAQQQIAAMGALQAQQQGIGNVLGQQASVLGGQAQTQAAAGGLFGTAAGVTNQQAQNYIAQRVASLQAAGMSAQQAQAQAQLELQNNQLNSGNAQYNAKQGMDMFTGLLGAGGGAAGGIAALAA